MKLMIKHLQEQLARASHQHLATPVCTENPDIEIATSSIGGTFHIQGGMHLLGACDHFSSRSVMHKTRLFGQSHWCHEAALVSRPPVSQDQRMCDLRLIILSYETFWP